VPAVKRTHHADGEIIVDYIVGHRAVLVRLHFDGLLLLLELEMLLLLVLLLLLCRHTRRGIWCCGCGRDWCCRDAVAAIAIAIVLMVGQIQ